MTLENKETPGAATPEVTVNIPSGRYYTAEEVEELLAKVTQSVPNVSLRSNSHSKVPKETSEQNRGVSADSKIFIGHVALGIDGSFATIGIKNPDDGSYLTATVNDDEVRLLTHALRTINEIAIRGD